ncbi:acyltransferase domain-containing protein [Nocardiopsis sp. HNM0947]|uniref:Acyltransferase domain-containing protein n=1 Tax=Nocardiopsis coralli TaxID=2772213 RepID=A0ABR9P037_9ACTN|nr:type I polyketide synthase [Nocardiopsis coralli]MBE2997204.1 acyltransferase domain-containing protein [Nocardiopsis coralli]
MTSRPSPSSVALTGIGARLPAGADRQDLRGPTAVWEALRNGVPATSRYPEARWKSMVGRLHSQDRAEEPWPVAHLDLPEHGSLDMGAFGLPAGEGAHLSPTQGLILQVVVEAVADAGLAPSALAGPETGLYVGTASPDEALHTFTDHAQPRLVDIAAGGAGMLATPVSRAFDTQGPLTSFDTSCSASAYALDAARRDIRSGRVEAAIVIGANTAANPVITRAFVEGGVLAGDGLCRPFDVDAHGYVRGEAVVAVVLRRFESARAGADRVYALIEHTAVGADGRSAGTGMPRSSAQAALLERAYAEARVPLSSVGYVLAHGTGTTAGDRAETQALAKAFGRSTEQPLAVGSVKGLWGHSEAASGLTSVIAAALSLHHATVPRTTGHTRAPGRVEQQGLRVPTRAGALPGSHVGVSSFGFSGALAHAILRRAPKRKRFSTGQQSPASSGAAVVALAEHTPERLHALAGIWARAVERDQPCPGQVADHAARRRDHPTRARAAITATTTPEITSALQALAERRPHPNLSGPVEPSHQPRVVWVFGGHGTAFPEMGRDLYLTDGLFAHFVDQARAALEVHGPDLWHPVKQPAVGLAATHQATWVMQTAMARTLQERWGLYPDAVVGHSLGETAAAHTAGILSLTEAARLVSTRSRLLHQVAHRGGMVAARVHAHTARDLARRHRVEVACHNGPTHYVFAGSHDDLVGLVEELDHLAAAPKRLPGAPPAHSRLVAPLMQDLTYELRGRIRPGAGHIDFVSTVEAERLQGSALTAQYWGRQLRRPVRLEQALLSAARSSPTLVVEVSPRPVLGPAMTDTRARHHLEMRVTAASDPANEVGGLAGAAASAYIRGLPVQWPSQPHPPLDLPLARWTEAPVAASWFERLQTMEGSDQDQAVLDVVHEHVADLAAVDVGQHDRERPLPELGLNSLHLLQLRARLLGSLPGNPQELPEHEPTIRSIATALLTLVVAPL